MTRPRKRSPKELRATAYHEAGHAVVTIALGFTVYEVTIIPCGDYLGMCREPGVMGYRVESRRERRSIARALIVSMYAGMHAQRLVDPEAPEFHGQCDEDDAFDLSLRHEVFPRIIDRVGDERHLAYLGRLRAEAGRLVEKHRGAIGQFANLLLRRRVVGRAEAEQFIEPLLG